MTIAEGTIENEDATHMNGTTEAAETPAPTVKHPTYLDLAKAVWKLGYRLSSWGSDDVFCVAGVNNYLRHFDLPELVEIEGNLELADNYLNAWYAFKTWNVAGELTEVDDQDMRASLARSVRAYLQRQEPKPRETMNEWLADLGLDAFTPPRHIGAYHVSHPANVTVNSAMIAQALNAMYPDVQAEVSYDHRVR